MGYGDRSSVRSSVRFLVRSSVLMFAPSVLIISVHVKRIRKSEGKIEEGN